MLVSGSSSSAPANRSQLQFILLTVLVILSCLSDVVRPPEVECRDFFRVEHSHVSQNSGTPLFTSLGHSTGPRMAKV